MKKTKNLVAGIIGAVLTLSMVGTAFAAEPRQAVYDCPQCGQGTVYVTFKEKIEVDRETCPIDSSKIDKWTYNRIYEVHRCDSCSYKDEVLDSEECIAGYCGAGVAHS